MWLLVALDEVVMDIGVVAVAVGRGKEGGSAIVIVESGDGWLMRLMTQLCALSCIAVPMVPRAVSVHIGQYCVV
jgi:hypothetical protein